MLYRSGTCLGGNTLGVLFDNWYNGGLGYRVGNKEPVLTCRNTDSCINNLCKINWASPTYWSLVSIFYLRSPIAFFVQIDVSENIEGSPSIILYTGNGSCTIEMDSKKQKVKYEPFFGHGTYLSPKYGAYLFLIALISGGACACCWFLKSSHVDGVSYQELEMERPDSHSANNVETTEGWDEGWDDDWDEIKEVKQPNGHQTANVLSDVIASRNSDAEEGRKDWDD